jgi:hypothetical protein
MERKIMTIATNATGDDEKKAAANGLDATAQHDEMEDLARELLLPNPTGLTANGRTLVVQITDKPGPLEFFRCHPEIRLTVKMVTPRKGDMGATSYGVVPSAEPLLIRHHFEPYVATLYPIVIDSNPPIYKLIKVKPPSGGRDWDNWSLSKRLALDIAVDKWIAIRSATGAYQACDPDPNAEFPEVVWPDWTEGDWLHKSLVVTELLIRGPDHPIFKDILHLR